jgi:hypothetical protein
MCFVITSNGDTSQSHSKDPPPTVDYLPCTWRLLVPKMSRQFIGGQILKILRTLLKLNRGLTTVMSMNFLMRYMPARPSLLE